MSEPVAWIEGPHGAIRRNLAFRLTGPGSLSWSLPLYLHHAPDHREVMQLEDERSNLLNILQQALDALEIGYEVASIEAALFHEGLAGWRPDMHKAKDADVQKIANAITALRAALESNK
jgi:hypothetical protein